MWAFDGRSWRASEYSIMAGLDYSRAERPVKYSLTLEPHGKHWLFALDVPATLPPGVSARHDLQLRSVRPIDARMRYEMTSFLDYRYGEKLPRNFHEFALRFDERRNPRTVALGRQWAAENPDPRRVIGRALQYFNSQFTYTLEPPLLESNDPYDEFLFDKKRGFCEHYAGSFALLMRAAGIPSRVVTGYQGGEINPINRELIVRQADAHAWVEVWIEKDGWVRVDPTSAVSPDRIDNGINAALGPIGVTASIIAADRLGILSNVRFAWDALNSQWNQWVLGYNIDRQRQFLARLGIDAFDWVNLATWLGALAFVVAGAVSLALVLRDLPGREPPAVRAWRRFGDKLAKAGLARAPHEGPLDYLARIRTARPDLAGEAEAITERYVRARYGEGLSPGEARELARRVRDFRAA
jgi:transglutaminase-like putative cysteine protease